MWGTRPPKHKTIHHLAYEAGGLRSQTLESGNMDVSERWVAHRGVTGAVPLSAAL